MVIRVSDLAYVHTTVAETFAFTSDHRSFALWTGVAREIRATSEDGRRFEVYLALGPVSRWVDVEVERVVPDSELVFVGTGRGLRVRYAIYVAKSGPGAQVRLETEIVLRPWLWPAKFFVAASARKDSTEALRRLQRVLGEMYQLRRRGLVPSMSTPGGVQIVLT